MTPKAPRLCFFNSDPKWGGGVTFYQDHVSGLKDIGYDVIGVCSPGSMLSNWYSEMNVDRWHIKVGRLSFINPIKVLRLVRFYKKSGIDTVIFTNSEDLKFGGLSAKIAGVPNIIYRRGLAVPIKDRWTNRYIFKKVLTHVMANSEETKATILTHLSDHINPNDIKVIYNGIDTGKYLSKAHNPIWQRSPSQSNTIVIGNAGRISPEKGQIQLIQIAKNLKAQNLDFIILIAGSGPLEAEIRDAIVQNKLTGHIKMLGYIDEMSRFMQSIDIFVLTSHWEGFGYVLVEAMTLKKPVVAYNTSSMPEVVIDQSTGLLADYKDSDDFANKIETMIEDKSLRNHMGEAGYRAVIAKYELTDQIQKFLNFVSS